jgi:hypothetical protein
MCQYKTFKMAIFTVRVALHTVRHSKMAQGLASKFSLTVKFRYEMRQSVDHFGKKQIQ